MTVENPRHYYTPAAWPSKHLGRPTVANLARYVADFEASTLPGGVNAHLGPTRVVAARILTNRGERREVATYAAR